MKEKLSVANDRSAPGRNDSKPVVSKAEILTELQGTLALEGIVVSDERLLELSKEYESARDRGIIDKLFKRARARFSQATSNGHQGAGIGSTTKETEIRR